MRFKIPAVATLILLGIMVLSAYSGSNNESTPDDKEDIIQKIEVNNSSFLEFSKDWDGFETVTIDIDKLRKAADRGNMTIKVMEECFNIEIQEKSRLEGENAYFYTGHITGSKEGRSDLYVEGEYLGGSVEPGEPWNVTYNIVHTDDRYNGKVVHIIFMQDWKK